MHAESRAGAAGIRYLKEARIDVPAKSFEDAVDGLVQQVRERAAARGLRETRLQALADELKAEREDTDRAHVYRWQAIAGIDPGTAPASWIDTVTDLCATVGSRGAMECLAVLSQAGGKLDAVRPCLETIETSGTPLSLEFAGRVSLQPVLGSALPWQVDEAAARSLRAELKLEGPLRAHVLDDLLGVPPPAKSSCSEPGTLFGALRAPSRPYHAVALVRARPASQPALRLGTDHGRRPPRR